MKILKSLVVLFAVSAVALMAAPAPLPDSPTYLGLAKTINLSSTGNSVVDLGSGLGGGMFTGTVAGFETRFWCVDSQLQLVYNQNSLANVIRLDQITAANTQYVGVTETGSPKWSQALQTGEQTAQDRYRMAAWLITQYETDYNTPLNSNKNKAIQGAIWTILHNNTFTGGYNNPSGSFGSFTVQSFIDSAAANFSGVDMAEWAVVSWVVDSEGKLPTNPDRQTFLVQVVPEPGFYGVLALGLSGLFMAMRRRKQS